MASLDSILRKDKSRKVRREIRRVFLKVWDPIGIRDEPNAQDEYDGYIGPVYELLTTGGSDEQIVEYLDWAVARMGMDGSAISLQGVVLALREIDLGDGANTAPSN